MSGATTVIGQSTATTFPQRPGFGSQGRQLTVKANHFAIKRFYDGEVQQYDIEIAPKCSRPLQRRVFAAFCDETSETKGISIAFDGQKIAYSAKPIAGTEKEGLRAEIRLPDGKNSFQVMMRIAAKVNMAELFHFMQYTKGQQVPITQVQVMDIVLKSASREKMVAVGNSRFFTKTNISNRGNLGGGLECWTGYFGSVICTQQGLTMNVDLTSAAFWQSAPLPAVMGELLATNPVNIDPSRLNIMSRRRLQALKNVAVTVNHRGNLTRRFKISRFTEGSARNTTFELTDAVSGETKSVTVAQYFETRYNKSLRFANLPCVVILKGNREPMYLPAEVCQIVGEQPFRKKLLPDQTAEMIKFACKKPHDRRNNIMEGVNNHMDFKDTDPAMRAWCASIDTRNMMDVNGRVLTPPVLLYGARQTQQPRDGAWNMRGVQLFQPSSYDSWGVIVCGGKMDYENAVGGRGKVGFVKNMSDEAVKLGIRVPKRAPPIIDAPNLKMPRNVGDVFRKLRDEAKHIFGSDPKFVLIIYKDDDGGATYNVVKHMAETEFGVATQFVKAQKAFNARPQYCANVWLKINAKLDGVNVCVDPNYLKSFVQTPTLVLGADVSHPGSDDPTQPSVCAVTGSLDLPGSRFGCSISYQTGRVEVIKQLQNATKERLFAFYQATKKKPEHILMFRDGVSESQFSAVLRDEVAAIQRACAALDASYKPKLTFLVLVKRHHTRFFPRDQRDGDRSGNVPAGFVADRDVATPHLYDFFLQSHAGLQGTCCSTHYHVLYDDCRYPADEIQAICNNLSYTFARCTRSVKLVPSVYYSHLAADRARKWILGGYALGKPNYPDASAMSTVSRKSRDSAGKEGETEEPEVDFSWCPMPKPHFANKMWFI